MGRQRVAPGVRREPEASDVPLALPVPYEALSDSPNLIDTERRDLAACEAAIDGLRVAFWAAGKALQVIRDARLYRAQYPTFEDYCEGRWQIGRRQVDRLIRAWPLAEALYAVESKEVNESQVRELLPLAGQEGEDAATIVYQAAHDAAADVGGVRVTAAVIKGAVATLPAGRFDKDEAISQVRAYVARLAADDDTGNDQESAGLTDEERWTAEAARICTTVRKVLGKATPDRARVIVVELRTLLDEAEKVAAS